MSENNFKFTIFDLFIAIISFLIFLYVIYDFTIAK